MRKLLLALETSLILFFGLGFHYAQADYSADITGSGSCTSDTYYGGGYECDKAFDDNTGTAWSSTLTAYPHWIRYDLGGGNAADVTKLTLKMTVDGSNTTKSFELTGSNDDAIFDSVYTGQLAENNTDVQVFTFSNGTAYRYYKLNFTDAWGATNGTNIVEMEMMTTVSPGGGGATTTIDGYGLWSTVATSTLNMITGVGVPFWEIALGFLLALFLLFFLATSLSSSMKWLLRRR